MKLITILLVVLTVAVMGCNAELPDGGGPPNPPPDENIEQEEKNYGIDTLFGNDDRIIVPPLPE